MLFNLSLLTDTACSHPSLEITAHFGEEEGEVGRGSFPPFTTNDRPTAATGKEEKTLGKTDKGFHTALPTAFLIKRGGISALGASIYDVANVLNLVFCTIRTDICSLHFFLDQPSSPRSADVTTGASALRVCEQHPWLASLIHRPFLCYLSILMFGRFMWLLNAFDGLNCTSLPREV